MFIILHNKPRFRYGKCKKEQLTDISNLANLLHEYDLCSPIEYLDLGFLGIVNNVVNYNSLIDLLNKMTKLIGINFDIYNEEEILIFNALKDKITDINGYISLSSGELDLFESSNSVKVFNCRVRVSKLPIVFQKFPNIEIIHIIGYENKGRPHLNYGRPTPYKTLLEISQIPQLKRIIIDTPYPGLIPKSHKFEIITKFND